jgi:hypothetical protein
LDSFDQADAAIISELTSGTTDRSFLSGIYLSEEPFAAESRSQGCQIIGPVPEDRAMSKPSNRPLAVSTEVAAPKPSSVPWWISALVIVGALLNAAGATLALAKPSMLVSPHDEINAAVHVYAGYLFSRDLAQALLLIALLAMGARRALSNLMILVGLIQLFDFCVDCAEARWSVAPGVLIFGILFLVAAARLSGQPFWKREAW